MLRTLVRDRATPAAERSDWCARCKRVSHQMNVRVHRAVADLDGVTGLRSCGRLWQGNATPRRTPLFPGVLQQERGRDRRALERPLARHHLFSLQQALHLYDAIVPAPAPTIRKSSGNSNDYPQARRGKDAPPPPKPDKAKDFRKRAESCCGMRSISSAASTSPRLMRWARRRSASSSANMGPTCRASPPRNSLCSMSAYRPHRADQPANRRSPGYSQAAWRSTTSVGRGPS